MDEEAIQIMQHIDAERKQLGRNLDEIEGRVKEATDVKHHFDRHTAWILGSALVGGFLLSRVFRKSSTSVRTPSSDPVRSLHQRKSTPPPDSVGSAVNF